MTLAAAACSKSEIATWDAKPRVWFSTANDTTLFVFSSQPEGTTESVVPLKIEIAGKLADTDRSVQVKDLGGSQFTQGTRYEIVSAIIPAGKTRGEVLVKLYKTENLETANDTLTFQIVPSEGFEVGLSDDDLRNVIIVADTWFQPAWWDSSAEGWLGYYSEKKLEIIYTVLGSEELFTRGLSWTSEEVSVAIYKLNRYCIENNIKYHPDDDEVIQFDTNTK